MKKIFFAIIISTGFLYACESSKVNNAARETGQQTLNGTWELNYITGPRIAFNGLYPGKKPFIAFNTADTSFNGNTSCNTYRGRLITDANNISFTNDMMLTKMFCEGQGETVYLEMLKKVNKFSITNDTTLTFMTGDVAMMRFSKK